ncbi:MAG: CapA family protein [Erysipelotrichia bacterium]|nr:CapA family protein [Erysipelotrichia bacterium]NCC54678.1 CapA family protein [Erysipelotrichia bacterium]
MKKLCMMLVCVMVLVGCTQTKETKKEKKVVNKDTIVSFVGVGDNLIHETVYQDAKQEDGSYDFTKMYSDVKKTISKSDIAFINQETVLGGSELGLSGYPTFNSPTEIAKNLEDTGFNLVNLATNHSLDKYESGIANELAAFANTNITVNGVYTSQEAYDRIPTFKKKGITFSFLAYTYGTNGIEAPNPYNVSYFSDEKITSDVAKAKEVSDVVIVSAHWGDENTFAPNAFQTHYAQLFADLDVDVVIGTHPHTIQPVAWIKGSGGNETLVVYSLGNFLGGMLTSDNAIGGMISFDFVKKEKSKEISVENVKWIPTFIHFEGNQNDILAQRYHYKTYFVKDYTDELANQHVLNGFEGNVVSLDYIEAKTKEVINEQFLK